MQGRTACVRVANRFARRSAGWAEGKLGPDVEEWSSQPASAGFVALARSVYGRVGAGTTMAEETRIASKLDLMERFGNRLGAVTGQVHTAKSIDDAAEVIAELALHGGTKEVIVAGEVTGAYPDLKTAVERAGVAWRVIGQSDEARDAPLGLSLARLAIAETGSVLLIEPSLADRAIGLMSTRHLVVCPADRLVASLDDASGALREATSQGAAYATFVTGPSRTADIERQLTIGVQGPAELHVLFIDHP